MSIVGKIFYLRTSQSMEKETLKKRFIGLYETEADAIFRYCFFRISSRENATDLTQETFTKYWDSLISGKDIKNDRAFIFMIARNLVIDLYRKKKSLSLDAILEENEDSMFISGVDKTKEDSNMTAEARFIIDKMNELEREVGQIIYLRFIEGLGPKDIAEILGVSANVVSVRLVRGLEKLRKLTGYNIQEKDK